MSLVNIAYKKSRSMLSRNGKKQCQPQPDSEVTIIPDSSSNKHKNTGIRFDLEHSTGIKDNNVPGLYGCNRYKSKRNLNS